MTQETVERSRSWQELWSPTLPIRLSGREGPIQGNQGAVDGADLLQPAPPPRDTQPMASDAIILNQFLEVLVSKGWKMVGFFSRALGHLQKAVIRDGSFWKRRLTATVNVLKLRETIFVLHLLQSGCGETAPLLNSS